jgi:hypothetical protein
MYCNVCTNLKRDLRGLRSRIEEELTRSSTAAAIAGFNPLFAVLKDYSEQRASYERHRIEVKTGGVHAQV